MENGLFDVMGDLNKITFVLVEMTSVQQHRNIFELMWYDVDTWYQPKHTADMTS